MGQKKCRESTLAPALLRRLDFGKTSIDYRNRRAYVPDCVRLTPRLAGSIGWLPDTCAYRLRASDKPLPAWHYLVSGDRDSVHQARASVIGKAISETIAGPLEQHIVWPGPGGGDADD